MRFSLEEMLRATGGRLTKPDPSTALSAGARGPKPVVISGVSTDTRTLQPGDLFVPLKGPRADGHQFIAEAFKRGAAASLAAHPVDGLPDGAVVIEVSDTLRGLAHIAAAYRRGLRITVVGVTGSVGKTTTTKMCAAVLSTRFRIAQTKEDWNAEIGVPLAILGLRPEHDVAVIEMAMRGLGQIAELVEIARPDIGVVTSIGESHLDLLGTRSNIAKAKGELIAGLPEHGTAVLNADDETVMGLAARARGRVLTYGLNASADVQGQNVRMEAGGTRFRAVAGGRSAEARIEAWGRHNVGNALAATAVGLAMGMDLAAITGGLRDYSPPKMRLQPVSVGDVLVINDAYNASPSSMRAAFEVLDEVAGPRRRVAVLGEMKELGETSAAMHREVGQFAGKVAQVVIAVGTEGHAIAEGARGTGLSAFRVVEAATNGEAVTRLRAVLRPGDVVLVKGSRALQMEEIVEALRRDR